MDMEELGHELSACLDGLYNYALRLAGQREAAEDLVQETCARAVGGCAKIPAADAVRPILFRILRNLFIDTWRAARRRPQLVAVDDFIESLPDESGPGGAPLDAILEEVLDDEILDALGRLDYPLRETLWLREVEEFSYREIADITGIALGTVSSRLARARRELAARLETYVKERGLGLRRKKERS